MTENANIIMNLTGFVLVFMLLYAAWPKVVVDTIRQRIFEIRDELFDMAVEGWIGFNDPVYIRFRRTANALIRFCHKASWPRIFCLVLTMRVGGAKREYVPIHENIHGGRFLRDKIRRMETEMLLLVLKAIYIRSPLLLLLTPLVVILAFFLILNPVQLRKLKSRAVRLSGEIVADTALVGMVASPNKA